jgi:thiamine-monophosphate kinase
MLEGNSKTNLSELGEFKLIKHLTESFKLKNKSSLKGVGDDAAVIDNAGYKVLVSTDMLVEGIHFDLSYTPLKHLGFKSVAVNVSDICAMNGIAEQITVSVAISSKYTLEAMEELYSGIQLACKKYNVDLIGGDTTSSLHGLTISVTVIGRAPENEITYRHGANLNDLICVTGDLGGAYMGLQILNREKQVFIENPGVQPDLDGNDYILERQLKPEARIDLKGILNSIGVVPTAMIDISDGLASEIMHICSASEKGCVIYEEKIPIDPQTYERAREFGLDPTVCALSGGEDYEILFTVPLEMHDKMLHHPDITIIGHITDKNAGNHLVTKSGQVVALKAQGWDGLKSA